MPDLVLQAIQSDADRRVRKDYATGEFVEIPPIPGISRNTEAFLQGQYATGPQWNDRMFRAACDLAGNGVPFDNAMPLLMAGAQPVNATEAENAFRTIESAYSQARLPGRITRSGQSPKSPSTFSISPELEFDNSRTRTDANCRPGVVFSWERSRK